jgi:hypothetical protein
MKTPNRVAIRLPDLVALDALLAILPLAQLALEDANPTLAEPAPPDPPTLRAARALFRALRRLDRAAERYADAVVEAGSGHPPPDDGGQLDMF